MTNNLIVLAKIYFKITLKKSGKNRKRDRERKKGMIERDKKGERETHKERGIKRDIKKRIRDLDQIYVSYSFRNIHINNLNLKHNKKVESPKKTMATLYPPPTPFILVFSIKHAGGGGRVCITVFFSLREMPK